MIMVIHTFGDYARFHPHFHAIATDGLFRPKGTFSCLPKRNLKELEGIFRSKVFAMIKAEGRISDLLIEKLMAWHHSGFSVDNGNQIARETTETGRRPSRNIPCGMLSPSRRLPILRTPAPSSFTGAHKENLGSRPSQVSLMRLRNEDHQPASRMLK